MDQRLVEQLDKVLALVDSSHEGEAVGAVRMARQILSRDGLSFGDLARAAAQRSKSFSLPRGLFSGQQMHFEAQIARLQQIINDMQDEQQNQTAQTEFWRRRATEIEQQNNLNQSEALRWKKMARETVEKLWDAGHMIANDELASLAPADPAPEAPVPDTNA